MSIALFRDRKIDSKWTIYAFALFGWYLGGIKCELRSLGFETQSFMSASKTVGNGKEAFQGVWYNAV